MGEKSTKKRVDLAAVPTDALLAAADERRRQLREQVGRFATVKIMAPCKYCGASTGVRERIRHRQSYLATGHCTGE